MARRPRSPTPLKKRTLLRAASGTALLTLLLAIAIDFESIAGKEALACIARNCVHGNYSIRAERTQHLGT